MSKSKRRFYRWPDGDRSQIRVYPDSLVIVPGWPEPSWEKTYITEALCRKEDQRLSAKEVRELLSKHPLP